MGLDMYLTGEKYVRINSRQMEDGFPVKVRQLELGYWRKHPNLHGYIVQHFADGVDDCQPIALDADDLRQIIEAVKEGGLPLTAGFFFGTSDQSVEQTQEDLKILEGALHWLESEDTEAWRSLEYRASW